MNIKFALTAEEIIRHHRLRRRGFLEHPWVNRFERATLIAFSMMMAMAMLSAPPRVAVGVAAAMALFYMYNHHSSAIRLPKYRISVARGNDVTDVVVTAEGISTMSREKTTMSRWTALHRSVRDADGYSFEFIDGSVRWIPDRAFEDSAELSRFHTFMAELGEAAPRPRSTEPEQPASVTLTSGTWHWRIERTDADRAMLTLTDPIDARNAIVAMINDEWVEWNAERIETSIAYPVSRSFIDHDRNAWKIHFLQPNLAEAEHVIADDSAPRLGRMLWLHPGTGVSDLPWTGLAHVPTDELREWFTAERTAAAPQATISPNLKYK